ncbi:unnamed protein product [Lathyrus sativus]|nr:unnamed protein product [Lathyrus sativus]
MAQAMASSMAGCLRGCSSQTVLEGSLQLSGPNRLSLLHGNTNSVNKVSTRSSVTVRAQQQESSRRAVIGLVATGLVSSSFVQAVFAEAIPIKVGGPPPLSGGLPGTLNSDEARDLKLPLKERFFIQPLPPTEAAARTKESAKEIVAAKKFIDQKAWPFLQNDLRLRAGYLRYDLKTIISSKPKDQKQSLKELTDKLLLDISNLDHAAKIKSPSEAEKYYAIAVSTLNDVLSKIA